MTDRIRKYIGLFFDELPYSTETAEACEKIGKALEEAAPDAAPDELAADYGSYEKLAALAGYTEEDARAWRSTEKLRDIGEVKKELRRQRWRSYLIAALLAGLPSDLQCAAAVRGAFTSAEILPSGTAAQRGTVRFSDV